MERQGQIILLFENVAKSMSAQAKHSKHNFKQSESRSPETFEDSVMQSLGRPNDIPAEIWATVDFRSKQPHRCRARCLCRCHLHWAASQGDSDAVRLLIKAGASMEQTDRRGISPFVQACSVGSEGCARVFLEAGFKPVWTTRDWLQSPIHLAAKSSPELVSLLLLQGASVHDTSNKNMSTPLAYAALAGNIACCRLILKHGANINTFDLEGDSPLTEAITRNAHQVLELFLLHGPSHTFINHHGHTILHKAAVTADVATCSILTNAKLKGIDSDVVDHRGMTALQHFNKRMEIPDELEAAFEALVECIRQANAENDSASQLDDESNGDDDFVDAQETNDGLSEARFSNTYTFESPSQLFLST